MHAVLFGSASFRSPRGEEPFFNLNVVDACRLGKLKAPWNVSVPRFGQRFESASQRREPGVQLTKKL